MPKQNVCLKTYYWGIALPIAIMIIQNSKVQGKEPLYLEMKSLKTALKYILMTPICELYIFIFILNILFQDSKNKITSIIFLSFCSAIMCI